MAWWFQESRNPEGDLQSFVAGLQAKRDGIESLVLFGSMASGEFNPQSSDVNLLLILKDVSLHELTLLHPALDGWRRRGHVAPVILQKDELAIYARALPIEFLDMREHHRVLIGADPFKDGLAAPDASLLRAQCQSELAVKQLKLRQALVGAGEHVARRRALIRESLPSLLTLLRAVLRSEEAVGAMGKLEAAMRLAGKLGADPMALERVQSWAQGGQGNDLELIEAYLSLIERALQHVARG